MFKNRSLIEAVEFYIDNGYFPIPIVGKSPAKYKEIEQNDGTSKRTAEGWQHLRLSKSNYRPMFSPEGLGLPEGTPINVGIVDYKSREGLFLIDIDLDCNESRTLARYFLPESKTIFGRKSSPGSHLLYLSDNKLYQKFSYIVGKDSDVTLLELRPLDGTRQTVFPPSVHKDTGEEIKFDTGDKSPEYVEFNSLIKSCQKLAAASILSRYWDEGVRQDLTIATVGILLKVGWEHGEIQDFLDPIMKHFDDPADYKTRMQGIRQTFKKFDHKSPVTGISKLKEMLPEKVFDKLNRWLGISRAENPMFENNNALYELRFTAKGSSSHKVANFTVISMRRLSVAGQGEYIDSIVKTETGVSSNVRFNPESFNSGAKLKATLCNQISHTVFTGTDNSAQLIKGFINEQEVDTVIGTTVGGIQEHNNKKYFVTEEGSLHCDNGKILQDDRVIYVGETQTRCSLIDVQKSEYDYLDYLYDFNSEHVVQGVLGWTAATFFKQYFISNKEIGGFPVLFLNGASGSGKSRTAQDIIYNIWGISEQLKSFIEQKAFTVLKYMSCTDNIPIVFDEAKTSRMDKQKADLFSNLVRITYDNSEGSRGRADQTIVHYRYCRPLVICSETGITETAHKDRTVFLTLGIPDSKKHSESFLKLRIKNLSLIGKDLLDYALSTDNKTINKNIQKAASLVPEPYSDRPKVCMTALIFGAMVMSEITGKKLGYNKVIENMREFYYGDSVDGTKTSEVDKTLTTWCLMSNYSGEIAEARSYIHSSYLEKFTHYSVVDGMLRLHIPSIFPMFIKWNRDYQHQGDVLDRHSFLSQVRNEPYFVDVKPVGMGSRVQRCLILDINKMIKKGVEVFFPWVEDELTEARIKKAKNF